MSFSDRNTRRLALVVSVTLACTTAANQSLLAQSNSEQPPELDSTRPESTYDEISDTLPLGIEPGVIEVVRERYPNGVVKIQREVTLDADGNYVNHGPWKMWDQAGKLLSEGQFHMGERVGTWTRWHGRRDSETLTKFPFNRFREPFGSQVNFTNGVMDGDWVIVDGEQNRCQLVSLKMGKRHGPTITWLPGGKIYSQWTFENSVPVGEVLQANENGELQQSQTYLNGRRVVTKTDHYNAGKRQKKIEEMYLAATTVQATPDDFWNLKFATYKSEGEDMRHGPSRGWYANGQKQHEGRFNHGKKVGRFTHWFSNGQAALVAEYRQDEPHGAWVWWHDNGQKKVLGSYEEGKPIGDWRWWDTSGRLTRHESMEDGEIQVKKDQDDAEESVETAAAEPLLIPTPAERQEDPLDFLR